MRKLPINFQIHIANEAEFQRAWDGLVALGYNVATIASERQYEENGVIKHNEGLGYIWSSRVIDHSGSKTTFSSFAEFLQSSSLTVKPKATMNDAIEAVDLDQEIALLQAEEEYKQDELNRVRDQITEKMNKLKGLQEKLGIAA